MAGGAPLRLTVNVRVAGVGSVLPAASVAATEKVCRPAATPAAKRRSHDIRGIASATQANVDSVSDEAQVNAGASVLIVAPSAGPEVIVVSGATVSTLNVREAGVGSVSGTELVATTWKACPPSASGG